MKILVVRLSCHGDVVSATSILPGLRAKYPDATIHFHADPSFAWPLYNNPFVDKIVKQPREDSYDLIISLEHHERWNDQMARVQCEIAGVEFNPPRLYFTEAELDEPLPPFAPRGFIAVAHRAGWENKCYPRMQHLIDAFPDQNFVQVEAVADEYRLHCDGYLGGYGLRKIAAWMRHCHFYVGVDTVFAHIAAALGKPMILALGPTSHELLYIPHASIVYNPRRGEEPLNHLPEGYPAAEADPKDLINALGERLSGHLERWGDNPRIIYTDGEGREWRP